MHIPKNIPWVLPAPTRCCSTQFVVDHFLPEPPGSVLAILGCLRYHQVPPSNQNCFLELLAPLYHLAIVFNKKKEKTLATEPNKDTHQQAHGLVVSLGVVDTVNYY